MTGHSRLLSAVLLVCGTASAACASTDRNWLRVPQATAASRYGGVIPGSWEKMGSVQPGASLVVTLNSGNRLEGTFNALDSTALAFTDRAGRQITVQRSEISRIVAPATSDSLTNGALIGAGTGLAVALAILGALGSQDGYVLPSAKVGAPLLLSGAGGLAGILIDRAHNKPERVLYLAPRSGSAPVRKPAHAWNREARAVAPAP